ncbi:MAG: hypothetical protein IJE02_04150 [Clostridia bacterium]|nr:hypothetical protein [Clostridia bacterium]
MTKFTLMLTEAEATALVELLRAVSDKGICDKLQRRTVDYVLDEFDLMYRKKIQNNYIEYNTCCEPIEPITDSDYAAFDEF